MKVRFLFAVLILAAVALVVLWKSKPVDPAKSVLQTKIEVIDRAKEQSTHVNLKALEREIAIYMAEQGRTPKTLEQLIQYAHLMTGDKDGWGTPIQYKRISDDSFQLISAGNDKKFGTSDDILLNN